MKIRYALLTAAAAAIIATPASANWFSDWMMTGMNRNVASAPSPTPDDLRAIGDSNLGTGKTYYFNKEDGHWHEIAPGNAPPQNAPRQMPPQR